MIPVFKKSVLALLFTGVLSVSTASPSFAIPTLQLDISNGSYDSGTETIETWNESFTLYAYLIPDSSNTLEGTYYISLALVPATSSSGSLGTININSTTIDVTSGMDYGVPPIENTAGIQDWDNGDLMKHDVYPTYFYEYSFSFSSLNEITAYNTQDRALNGGDIDLTINSSGDMYYASFTIDTALVQGYGVHFDLYNTELKTGGDIDVDQFAPFSHDAESVPEPGTLGLLSLGLLSCGAFWKARKMRNGN